MSEEDDLSLLEYFLWADLERRDRFEEFGQFEDDYAMSLAYLKEIGGAPTPSLLPQFFARFPQLLMPLGFDEYYLYRSEEEPAHALSRLVGRATVALYPLEPCFRRPTGEWLHFTGFDADGLLAFHGSSTQRFGVEELLRALRRTAGDENYWLGTNWTPAAIDSQRLLLRTSAVPLLKGLQEGHIDIDAITPLQLEHIVAELLDAEGHEVVTTPSKDGGRDVIVRGRFGQELIYMAVEVKKRPKVNIGEFRSALHANAHYAALMVVTSGRFASGVIEERAKPANRARVFLRDRSALTQMIAAYSDDATSDNASRVIHPGGTWVEEMRRVVPPEMLKPRQPPPDSGSTPTARSKPKRSRPRVVVDRFMSDASWESIRTGPTHLLIQVPVDCDHQKVAKSLRQVDGITHVFVVSGPYDLIAHSGVSDRRSLDRVIGQIKKTTRINRVIICLSSSARRAER